MKRVLRFAVGGLIVLLASGWANQQEASLPLGLGLVSPRTRDLEALRFYGPENLSQVADMLAPTDSVTFVRGPNQIDIATAPPYLVPEVLKLDYDMLYFRATTVSRNWIEIVVNQRTGQTAWVDRHSVDLIYWPEFLSQVYAVEVVDQESNPLRIKPLGHASVVTRTTEPLRPLAVNGHWILVETIETPPRDTKSGWIRWRDGDTLLITYSILS